MKQLMVRLLVILSATSVFASPLPVIGGDINVRLNTSDGSSKFSVKDSGDGDVAHIASDGSTYIKGNVGIGTTDTSTGKLVVNGNIAANPPTADEHVATKGYVDASLGGGCKPVWRGYTTTRYYGDMDGFLGMNSKCHSEYPGSHACTMDELIRLGNMYPASKNAWVVLGYGDNNCYGWNISQSKYYGFTTQGDYHGTSPCNYRLSIPCCE